MCEPHINLALLQVLSLHTKIMGCPTTPTRPEALNKCIPGESKLIEGDPRGGSTEGLVG